VKRVAGFSLDVRRADWGCGSHDERFGASSRVKARCEALTWRFPLGPATRASHKKTRGAEEEGGAARRVTSKL
jgi:hypothetical protein